MSRGGGFRRQGGLVEIETDAGVHGIGEAFGNPHVTREYFRMVEPMFVGRSVFDFDHVEARVRNALYHLGVGNQLTACLAAINVALFDAIARGFGVRLCDLIGGCGTTRIPAYASTGFFSNDPDRQFEHMLAEAAAHPYAGAKIKIGRGLKSDVERVRQARKALGPDKLLMVDINGAYTADVALACARALSPYDIHWIEEPLPPGDLQGYAELRARSPIPIAAGEAHHTVRDFRALIDGRCVDIVQPSIPGTGGLTEAKRIATLAQAHNLRIAPHAWGGAVGLATACHFIASLPAGPHTDHPPFPQMLEYDMSDNALRTQLLKVPLKLEAGHVLLPEGPGLGIELDWQAVERYRIC
jgi:D-galactarolactone cycloisomerase